MVVAIRSAYSKPRRTTSKTYQRSQRGSALLVVLTLLTVSLVPLALYGLTNAKTELRIAHNDHLSKQALASAESGIAHAFKLLEQDIAYGFDDELGGGGTGGRLAGVGTVQVIDGDNYRFAGFGGSGASDGYYVRIVDNHDELPNDLSTDSDDTIKIIARGRINDAERRIEAIVSATKISYALFGKHRVRLTGGGSHDGYDSSVGYSPGGDVSVGSNGDVEIEGGTRVDGEVTSLGSGDLSLVGVATTLDGDARAGGTISTGTATITGSQTSSSGDAAITWPPVVPCGPPYSDGTGITGSYDATTGDLTTPAGIDITFADGTYCLRSIVVNAGATLTVNGTVTIYLTENSRLEGGGIINTTGLPSNLRIYSSAHELDVSGHSQAVLIVYAPDTDVRVTGGSDFFGSLIGDRVDITGNTNFHGDTNLNVDAQLSSMHEVGS